MARHESYSAVGVVLQTSLAWIRLPGAVHDSRVLYWMAVEEDAMVDPTIGGKDRESAESSEADGKEPRTWSSDRAQLVWLEQKSQEAYDNAVLILSGGALGLSLVVFKDYLGLRGGSGSGLIALALLCWALSVSCILFSSVSSRKVLASAIRRVNGGGPSLNVDERSDRVASGLSVGSAVLFLVGVALFAVYVAIQPAAVVKQPPVPTAPDEITRFLSLYDTIKEVCPDCSADEARKVLQACEGSYMVPDVLREACPRCTDKAIVQLNRRCMEKWNSPRTR